MTQKTINTCHELSVNVSSFNLKLKNAKKQKHKKCKPIVVTITHVGYLNTSTRGYQTSYIKMLINVSTRT